MIFLDWSNVNFKIGRNCFNPLLMTETKSVHFKFKLPAYFGFFGVKKAVLAVDAL